MPILGRLPLEHAQAHLLDATATPRPRPGVFAFLWSRRWLAGSWLVMGASPLLAQTSVCLVGTTSGSYRWQDAAGNLYGAAYRAVYSYTQATVCITYSTNATVLHGALSATNLKPNFAYQLKLSGHAEEDPQGNEDLGFHGRWWQEEWNGTAWANGWNLNDKGDGTSPSPNDLVYLSRRDITNATSPTGLRYRYTGYRPFDYFVTDEQGCASLQFTLRNAYHVLWKTSQWYYTSLYGPDDGPIQWHDFDPDPASQAAYSTDYGESSVGVFGEWERRPRDGVYLPPGAYRLSFQLTEESFHESGDWAGFWALAGQAEAVLTVVPPVLTAAVDPSHGGAVVPEGEVVLPCGGETNCTIRPAPYWRIQDVEVDGQSVGPTNGWAFRNVTQHRALTARFEPDLTAMGVPKWWLAQRNPAWTNDFDAAALGDGDADGMLTWEEYLAGTDPTNPDSVFEISAQGVRDGIPFIQWLSPCGDPDLPPFVVEQAAGPGGGWMYAGTAARSPDGTNLWYGTDPGGPGGVYYRVVVTNSWDDGSGT